MTSLLVFTAVHVLVPLLLLTWQWRAHIASRAQWLARTAAFTAFFIALHLGGFWTVLPHWLSYVYFVLFVCASIASFRNAGHPSSSASPRLRIDVAVHAAFAVLFAAAALYAALGHLAPRTAMVDLAFPLGNGVYAIASGGANRLMNFHLKTADEPRFARWRGQSHAVDIVQLNRYGVRASGFAPREPQRYAIFGKTVLSPCAGRVEQARGDLPDQNPPRRDAQNLAGNFVFLDCAGVRVLVAHLRQGSLRVKDGVTVQTGQPLGEAGNSGNTSEPHVHIHAQRPGSVPGALDGEPLPIRFAGRYLARNDRVRVP
ncbi:MAG TPA: M23 family metallopeptidase [Burkholderiales bacterium]|nr:M23 family metallopeptidase [Burkholderiales bacterium]